MQKKWKKRDDMVVHETEPFNAEPPREALTDRPLTPLDTHYVRSHGPVPLLTGEDWELTVDGLVARPLRLSLRDLQTGFPAHELTATLQCAGNRRTGLTQIRDVPDEAHWGPGAIATAHWRGARLCDVLAAAELREDAAHIAFTAPDVSTAARPPQEYGGSIPAAKALSGEVLLAWAMNGRPLPPVHGAPLRVVVPGWIGARSVKWLRRVSARHEPSDNYYQSTSYRLLPPNADRTRQRPGDGVALGPAVLNCDILRPVDGAALHAGACEVAGYAYAGGGRDVVRVDVSSDGGRTWTQAELDDGQGRWAWRLWRATVELPPRPREFAPSGDGSRREPDSGQVREPDSGQVTASGEATAQEAAATVEITARAWDSSGATQPESPAPLWNPGGYVNNSWARARVRIDGRR